MVLVTVWSKKSKSFYQCKSVVKIKSRNIDNVSCEISIQDNGIGFANDHVERISNSLSACTATQHTRVLE